MLKGVSKQIIEINYTNNDYVQKAILIINPQKANEKQSSIKQKAFDYVDTLNIKKPRKSHSRLVYSLICGTIGSLFTAIIFAIIQ